MLHWFYTGVWFSTAFYCSMFELSTENIKKKSWDKTVLKMWSQNLEIKMLIFAINVLLKELKLILQMFIHFWAFLLFCSLVSDILTIIFRGSAVCLERCDSYGNFGYLKKI